MNRREFVEFAAMASWAGPGIAPNTESPRKALFVLPANNGVYDIGHGEARILAGAEDTGGAWWAGSLMSEAGRKTSLHVHYSADEQLYVLEGVLSVWMDDRWQDLPVGGLATAPRGVPHALGNRTTKPLRYLVVGNPAGFEKFFVDIEAAARKMPYASPEFLSELAQIYTKYDSKLLGPPPVG